MSEESSKPAGGDLCDDLFSAACLAPDGQSKYEARSKRISESLNRSIRESRDKTAKLMGFKDFDDALKAKLNEAGLKVIEPVDPESWKALKGVGSIYSPLEARKLYAGAKQCYRELEELETSQSRDAREKLKAFQSQNRAQRIRLYAQDLPEFVNKILNECRPSDDQPLAKGCERAAQIKREAVSLYRIEGRPEYREKSEEFVRKHFQFAEQKSMGMDCHDYSSLMESAGNRVFRKLVVDIDKSKPTVEALIDAFYGESRKKTAEGMFRETRADIQSIVGQFVKDPQKKAEIFEGYDRLQLFWMDKPASSAYKENGGGIPVLDESKSTSSVEQRYATDIYATFSDPSLSFFTELNADYLPTVSMGKTVLAERVSIMPVLLRLLDENPYSFMEILAHEAGHRIGPQMSRVNGFDLKAEYRDLLACYKSHDSIKLRKGQEDEVIADYISSEVLARQISRLPVKKRRQALMSAVAGLCVMDEKISRFNADDVHPEQSLRASGIYGANPNLRAVVGCTGDSPKYKSCALKGLVIPEPAAAKSREATAKGIR